MKILDIFTTKIALILGGKEAIWLTRYLIERYGIEIGLEYDLIISVGTLILVFIIVSVGTRKIYRHINKESKHRYHNIIKFFLDYLWAITSILMFLIPISYTVFSNLLLILNTLLRN